MTAEAKQYLIPSLNRAAEKFKQFVDEEKDCLLIHIVEGNKVTHELQQSLLILLLATILEDSKTNKIKPAVYEELSKNIKLT